VHVSVAGDVLDPAAPRRHLPARTLGVLAVLGLVVAFSVSSTLAKRAETPGVLIAFWRLAVVSLAWNVVLWSSGRRVQLRDVKAVWIPAVFFGLNLAVFFAGATHNSVANAALIGACAPLVIVPVGALLFGESIDRRALVFAVIAFGGVALVLLSAPPGGDASLEGNVFGVVAMFLLVGYVASARYFRREMDVTSFMATICPIATVAVFPVALVHGGALAVSSTGWTYVLILGLTSGIAAQGLLIYAQKTIQIGTIGIAQDAQPALAVVWSFLLLGEIVNARQGIGIAVVIGGLVAFTALNAGGGRFGRAP
jgi:drug/metabolite transporter (DMT)-like permease